MATNPEVESPDWIARDLERRGFDMISLEEARVLLDQQARALLGMSGDEFVAAYESGRIWPEDDDSKVARLAMWLPFLDG